MSIGFTNKGLSMINIIITIGVTICIMSSLSAMIISLLALAKVIGLEKSTHKVEYVPIDPNSAQDFAKQLADQIKDEQQDTEL